MLLMVTTLDGRGGIAKMIVRGAGRVWILP